MIPSDANGDSSSAAQETHVAWPARGSLTRVPSEWVTEDGGHPQIASEVTARPSTVRGLFGRQLHSFASGDRLQNAGGNE